MSTSNNENYTINFAHDAGGLWGFGSLFGLEVSDIDPVYVSTLFTSLGTVYKVTPLGNTEIITEKVTNVTFTISYANTSLTLHAGPGSSNGQIKLWGTHEGVFQKEEWWTRNSREQTGRDPAGKEVNTSYVTIVKSYAQIPNAFYEGYKAVPDRTLSTSITWTITCKTATTSVTFTNVSQNIHNNWDAFRRHIRPFVIQGSGESNGSVTTYK